MICRLLMCFETDFSELVGIRTARRPGLRGPAYAARPTRPGLRGPAQISSSVPGWRSTEVLYPVELQTKKPVNVKFSGFLTFPVN